MDNSIVIERSLEVKHATYGKKQQVSPGESAETHSREKISKNEGFARLLEVKLRKVDASIF